MAGGKQATKGRKQIVEENKETLRFYQNLALGVNVMYFMLMFVYLQFYTLSYIFVFLLCLLVYGSSYAFMVHVSMPKYSSSGALIESGLDLNMEGGFTEHVKDLMILTAGCQLLSVFSDYAWILWILVPIRLFWLGWVNVLGPYFARPIQTPIGGISERKQRRMDRRMHRQAH